MDNLIWGKLLWILMHSISYNIPSNILKKNELEIYSNFYKNIKDIIPCEICKSEYSGLIKLYYLNDLNNKNEYIIWVNNIHNIINSRLEKKIISIKDSDNIFKNTIFFNESKQFFNIFSKIALDIDKPKYYIDLFNFIKVLCIIHPISEIKFFLQKVTPNTREISLPFLRKWFKNLEKTTV